MAARPHFLALFTVLIFLTAVSSAADQPAIGRLQLRDWKLQSACEVKSGGEVISTLDFNTAGWHTAEVPSTVVGALIADHTFPDPNFGDNITRLPGYSNKYDFANADMPEGSPFKCSWWYRTEFSTPAIDANLWLHFDGINYRANIWLNGKKIADSKDAVGAFRAYEFKVSDDLAKGSNVLAVEVAAPNADDLGITWWDWSPTPPDKNMGLWKDVYLSTNGPVSLRYPLVTSKLSPSLQSADLGMQVEVRNDSASATKGILHAEMDGIKLEQPVELTAGEKKTVRFATDKFPALHLQDPKLWWPYQMGTPALHYATFSFESGGKTSDSTSVRFGIRETTSELDANKNLIFKVNGRRVFIKGGGWASDMLLRQSPKRLRDEFAHVRQLNLNTIRLEGTMETDAFFDLADEQGILIIAGWMCCDMWQLSDKWTPETHAVARESMRTQSLRLRSHPSMLAWLYGSDEPAPENTEREYLQALEETGWPNPALSSASATPSPLSGPSGVKMSGPYDYVPPAYWSHPKAQSVTLGGGFGFNTETSPGPAIPTVQSLKKFIPTDHLWPINEVWNVHAGGNEFANLNNFNRAMNASYGPPKDLNDYERKAQAMAYNGERAMFEAYSGNRYAAGGVVQWMLNNAWPSIYWHLYDYYLQTGGGYFGTRKANEPVHIQYSYGDRSIRVVNNQDRSLTGARVTADLYDDSLKKFSSQHQTITAPANSSTRVFAIPASQAKVSFLKLTLRDKKGQPVSDNFYWLSADEPTFDWEKTTFVNTPSPHYEDLSALNRLPEVELTADGALTAKGNRKVFRTVVTNPSKDLAFQIVLRAYSKQDGSDILPVLWDDNYFSLLPGESKMVTASMAEEDLHGAEPAIEVTGWNVKTTDASFEHAPRAKASGPTVQERMGYPANARLLIIHADDLGMNHSVNRATFEALEKHWITSSSILVPCPWFPEVVRWAQSHPDADLGIHLALNSEWTDFRWGPVSAKDQVPSLLDQQGYLPLLETAPAAQAKLPEVETELRAQIERARSAGIRVSHFDTHMTALMQSPPLLTLYEGLGNEYKLPILLDRGGSRQLPAGVVLPQDQALLDGIIEISPGIAPEQWTQWYEKTLSALKPGSVYEVIVHLAHDDDEMRGATWDHPDWGAAWRQHDFDMVSSNEFQQFLKQQNFTLVKWSDVAKALPAH